jgi:hypothetical protein
MILSMTACGGSPSAETPKNPDVTPSVSASADPGVTPSESESANPGKENEGTEEIEEIAFEEVVVVDNEECTIKITGIDPENFWGYTLKVYLENKSAEKTYMYSVTSATVDGVESDPFFASEVAAGKKANESLSFSDTDLVENGIEFTDIQLTFRVYDSNDWMADDVAKETIHIYPRGEENAVAFVREPQSADIVLVDNESVTAIITGFEEDSIWGYTANLFLVNKTDAEVMFSVDEASVNGFMADPFFATSVLAGKCRFTSLSWSDTTLEENGITEIETIEFVLRAYDANDWMAEDFVNEVITVNP